MTSVAAPSGTPFGTKIRQIAEANPDGVGLVFVAEDGSERTVTFGELDARSTQLARVMSSRGLTVGQHMVVSLKNSPEHLIATFAGWKVGAVVIPMRWNLPDWERERVLATIHPQLIVDTEQGQLFEEASSMSTRPLPEVTPPHAWGICSSGSTGTPKVIMMKSAGLYVEGASTAMAVEWYGPLPQPQRVLIPAPLYHSNGFMSTRNLMSGVEVILLERFDAQRVLHLIERHRVTGFVGATPMLQRLVQAPEIDRCDLSSLDWVQQGASPLPVWLGRRWCELVGPEHFFVTYGASERHGLSCCRGDEWLEHPGTVGRAYHDTEIVIIDDTGMVAPAGEVGGIYMRKPTGPDATYMGDDVAPLLATDDGFVTVGDMGSLDQDGYLYIADRRVDMIVTGGANVFPAEVEAALSEHPGIADVVVVGLRDAEWGRRIHAIVQPLDPARAPDAADVISFAKTRLAAYKVPKTVELIAVIPRNDVMKLNRTALTEERDGPQPTGEVSSVPGSTA
jgi:bile acid-coenzyme A ligase